MDSYHTKSRNRFGSLINLAGGERAGLAGSVRGPKRESERAGLVSG